MMNGNDTKTSYAALATELGWHPNDLIYEEEPAWVRAPGGGGGRGKKPRIERPPVEFIGWRKGPRQGVEYLVDRMMKRRGAGILGGQVKDGKSTIAANLTGSVLTGQSFAGRLTMRQGGVLWLINEGEDEIDDNVQEAVRAMGGNMDDQPFIRVEGAQHLQEDDAETWLDDIVKKAAALFREKYGVALVLVVVDTIISVGAYEDDNSRAITAAVMQKIRNVSMANDLFTLVLDHVGKDKKKGIMGSVGKMAAADTVLVVDVNKKNNVVVGRKMVLAMMRGGQSGSENHFEIESTNANANGDSFAVVKWTGVEQVSLSGLCNTLLQSVRECENESGNLLSGKREAKVPEDVVRKRFYGKYNKSDDACRRAYGRAVAQALEAKQVLTGGGQIWLV
jgi:hypothetical protein